MLRKQYLLSLVLVASFVVNGLPLLGQTGVSNQNFQIPMEIQRSGAPEVFAQLQRSGRDEAFAQALATIANDQGDTSDALDAQGAYFFEQFRTETKGLFDAAVEKGKESNRIAYEQRKGQATSARPAPRAARSKRVYGKSVSEFMSQLIGEPTSMNSSPTEPIVGDLQIKETETETSKTATTEDIKVIDSPEATVTNTQGGETKLSYDKNEMSMTTSTSVSQKNEAVSKTSSTKATKANKMEWSTTFAWCPDAEGKVRGKAKAFIFNQTSIIKGTQIAASTTEYTMEFHITGYVNDDAEMMHFDMEGVVSEKVIGFDRGIRMGLIQAKPGVQDGSATIIYNIANSTPPTDGKDVVLGTVTAKIVGFQSDEHLDRVLNFAKWGIGMTLVIDLSLLMKTSISRWQNGECVDVECKPAKTALKPNEAIDIMTVSISKHDLGKINAKLNGGGTQTVTPEDQEGTPSAVYTLTAPPQGGAMFLVKSVSKRGIGSNLLNFTEDKKTKKPPVKSPPVKTPGCDGGWTGTVKAVKIKSEKKEKGQDGRLVRQVESKNESFDVKVTVLGTRDTTAGILNNYHGNAESGFLSTKYSESNYAPGKMSCNKTIITTPQTQKMEIQEKGEANGKTLVAIALNGSIGIISFTAPEVAAERIVTRTMETACASYNAVNSSTDRSSSLIDISGPWFEVEFQIDPSSRNVLKGSKTIQNSDGSETIFTWDLTRCQ